MKDPEFIQLKNRFLTGVFIVILFSVPLFIFMYKTYLSSDAMTMISKDKTFVMLVVSNDCEKCDLVKDILKERNINVVKVNKDTNKDYDNIMLKMGITNKKEQFPIIVYVENGEMKANLLNVTTEKMIDEFIEFHQLNDLAG